MGSKWGENGVISGRKWVQIGTRMGANWVVFRIVPKLEAGLPQGLLRQCVADGKVPVSRLAKRNRDHERIWRITL